MRGWTYDGINFSNSFRTFWNIGSAHLKLGIPNNQPREVKMSDEGWEDDGWKDEETSNTTAQVGPGGDGLSPQEGGGGGDGYRREGHFVRECPHGGGGNNKCRN